jgi:hypothetical protein
LIIKEGIILILGRIVWLMSRAITAHIGRGIIDSKYRQG